MGTFAILISPFVALLVGATGLYVHHRTNRRNRNLAIIMQLSKDFYQDTNFTVARLKMWDQLIKMEPEDKNYRKLIGTISNDRSSALKPDEAVALSRTAAFYNSIRGLIETNEANVEMLKTFFSYNYSRFWNEERKQIVEHSEDSDKLFFVEIPELFDPTIKPYNEE